MKLIKILPVVFLFSVFLVSGYPDTICYPLSSGAVCFNTTTITGIGDYGATSGDNTSWNQSLADSLYAPISVTGDNASWNESYADTKYALVGAGADNTSWNESYANTLYTPITNLNSTYWQRRVSNCSADSSIREIGVDGSVVCESDTDTQLSDGDIAAMGYIKTYSETDPNWAANMSNYVVSGTVNAWKLVKANITDFPGFLTNFTDNLGHIQDNTSWNQSKANSLYTTISNLANNISKINTNILNNVTSIYSTVNLNINNNRTTIYTQIDNNVSKVNTNILANTTAYDECSEISGCVVGAITDGNTNWDNSYGFITIGDVTQDNASWNQSGADELYYSISNPSGFISEYQNLTEDNVEAYIFDNDNTASLNLSGYNITGVNAVTFTNNMKIYVLNSSALRIG